MNPAAVLIRTVLSDTQWDRIKGLVPGKESDRGVTGRNNRLFVESVLWVARTGRTMARFAGGGRRLEQHFPALLALVESGGVGESFQGLGG